ncbi:hypothetical protein [Desulfovibrio inopinatus]|uniref:hypothetical protein n=1 Tax=Desulfovibrio inopinatus TaxID=102109 RepID=UPI00048A251E|nr:hypothetical protein [Desulfovibrio inopinatus]
MWNPNIPPQTSPHPDRARALGYGNRLFPSMMHRITLSSDEYSLALTKNVLVINEIFGIMRGDSLHITEGPPLRGLSGRSFFAYAMRKVTGEHIKDGCAVIIIYKISPHDPEPWYSKQAIEEALHRTNKDTV